jgi:hypothetical protein
MTIFRPRMLHFVLLCRCRCIVTGRNQQFGNKAIVMMYFCDIAVNSDSGIGLSTSAASKYGRAPQICIDKSQ